jgi:hypothetical protein
MHLTGLLLWVSGAIFGGRLFAKQRQDQKRPACDASVMPFPMMKLKFIGSDCE